jgi:branched-chain amino acid transport system substrate-binding protein
MSHNTDESHVASRRGFLRTASVGAGAAAMLAGLNQSASAQDANPVIIGGPLPLTGIVAADGIEFKRGMEMAADEINAMGGILGRPIQLAFEDTQSLGDDVITSAAQRLVDRDKVSALISRLQSRKLFCPSGCDCRCIVDLSACRHCGCA